MISERMLQKNLRALSKKHPELARKIEQAELPSGWYIREAKNGMPTLEVDHEGKRLSVHSRYNPQKEALSWCKAIPGDWDVLVIFGFGLGYHYETLVSLYPDKEIIIVENDLKHLRLALSAKDLVKTIRQHGIRIVVSQDPMWNSNEIVLRHFGKNIVFQALSAYQSLFSDFFSKMQINARDCIRLHRVNAATVERFNQQWLENYVENALAYVQSCPVKDLFNLFENRPAIIVASGPSLDKNVHMLNELKDSAIIIAAGSANRVLEKNGVRPHLLVSFDGGEFNYRHFEHFDAGNLPLVFAPTIYSRIISEYQGPLIGIELDVTPFVSWFNQQIGWEPGVLRSGPSVAHVCFDLANKMGANPIILVGQDLAFTNLKTHADGAKHQRSIDPKNKNHVMVEDIFGNEIPTSKVFYSMKTWFEQLISSADDGKQLVIDASEGGAKIAATEILTLREVADRYLQEKFYPQTLIDEIIQTKQYCRPEDYTAKLKVVVESIMAQYDSLEKYCQMGISYAAELINKSQKGAVSRATLNKGLKEFKRLDNQITNLEYFQVFLKENVAHRFQAINLVLGKRMREEQDYNLKVARLAELYSTFFEQTQGFANIVLKYLQDMKRMLD